MAQWDDRRGQGEGPGRERDQDRRRGRFSSDEARYGESRGRIGPQGRSWDDHRYDARFDQDRTGYGGQEYGMEGRSGSRAWDDDRRRDAGSEGFGRDRDYAYHPREGQEFDPDYLHWREEQMRGHDRDYHEWRSAQRDRYDEDYRRFRAERRDHFGRSFQDWRSQRSMVGGVPDTGVTPGRSGYGDNTATPGNYTGYNREKPSGMIEPPNAITADPAMTQTGGGMRPSGNQGEGEARDASPEFGKEPAQVKAATDGSDGRGAAEDERRQDGREPPRR